MQFLATIFVPQANKVPVCALLSSLSARFKASFKGPRRCRLTRAAPAVERPGGEFGSARQQRNGVAASRFQSSFPGRAAAFDSRDKRRCPQPSPPAFAWPPGLLQGGGLGKAALRGGRPCGVSPERPAGKRAPLGNSNHATPPDGGPRLAASLSPHFWAAPQPGYHVGAAQKRHEPRSARRHQQGGRYLRSSAPCRPRRCTGPGEEGAERRPLLKGQRRRRASERGSHGLLQVLRRGNLSEPLRVR